MATKDAIKERTKHRIKEPKQYHVIMLNDDFTTMEFVVEVLMDIFHKDEMTAQAIMMQVHKNGKAIVGKYPYDIATTKVGEALARAKAEGFPFRMVTEEEH
ncbi:MAG: ATP-dependent Clp protease adaptor ClpS [Eubacteriales bacterium]|nr:ATP-dependent Clp protease adaptor ClpS [Eubacteriales bacterium]